MPTPPPTQTGGRRSNVDRVMNDAAAARDVLGAEAPLPRGRHKLDRDVVLASQRGRLIAAFARLAAEQGYDNVTIIDIVTLAGTSKRTFYEHFADKNDLLLQTFDTARELIFSTVIAAADPIVDDSVERVRVGVHAYITVLVENPDFARLFLSESLAAGPQLADEWLSAIDTMAGVIHGWREASRQQRPEVPALPLMRAQIVLHGLNHAIAMLVHREGIAAVAPRRDEIVDHVIALLLAP